jgi:hypothetical protein
MLWMTMKPVVTKEMRRVAQDVIAAAVECAINQRDVGWEDYPTVAEDDWERIVAFAKYNSQYHAPSPEKLHEALVSLALRADVDV